MKCTYGHGAEGHKNPPHFPAALPEAFALGALLMALPSPLLSCLSRPPLLKANHAMQVQAAALGFSRSKERNRGGKPGYSSFHK